jgi:hypothetical protein
MSLDSAERALFSFHNTCWRSLRLSLLPNVRPEWRYLQLLSE